MMRLCKLQALNNLAVTNDNKLKIVEAGALPHYVKLLSPERGDVIHRGVIRGLYLLASKCRDRIIHEPGCLDGCYLFLSFLSLFSLYVPQKGSIGLQCGSGTARTRLSALTAEF